MQKKYYSWIISKSEAGKKLLTFLKEKLYCSNKVIKKALEKGLCLVNNKIERFGSIVLSNNAEVKLNVLWKKIIVEKPISIRVLYEDEYFIAIDKPSNFVSSDQNIHQVFPKKYTLIHRLDKDTTGVLLIAKNTEFKEKMIALFENHKVLKKYLAMVDGYLNQKEKKIESNIKKIKSFDGQSIYGSSKDGKYALTYLKVLDELDNKTLVELTPVTGRTHQLRVHMKQISHPILGDFLYSKKFSNTSLVTRIMLHCYEVKFMHPMTHEEIIIISEPADDFFS
jgi:RluA family pseudouridine synthase